ncbi:MAG: hypothetical protein JSW45_03340 [Thiotrichales bacterium]|nr:MAG: hypothetical protein JSW45_03340 [Thiotrichales bacterium]
MSRLHISAYLICLSLVCSPASSVNEFEQWKQQQQQSFQQYKDERDREFTAFLKEHWREVEMLKGVVRDDRPKPVVMPVAEPVVPEPDTKPIDKPVEEKPEPVVIELTPALPVEPAPVPRPEQKGLRAQVDYFGVEVTFYYDPAFKRTLPYNLNETALSNFWSDLSRADFEPVVEQIDTQAEALQLNDWGYVLLTHRLAERIYPAHANKQALFTWFILAKAGFGSRVAYNDRKVYLLIPSEQQLYDVTYFTFDDERYYAVSFDGSRNRPGSAYTYDGQYPGAAKKLDMSLRTKAPKAEGAETRSLVFEYGGRRYAIKAEYDQARIDFLGTYPQLDLEIYFDAEVGATAESPLLQLLAKELAGMSEQEAVNFLLRFVQTSFRYRTDDQQFGRENYLFPEETIFYPYSDCEDRSVLFAWLVKSLLGLEVVGLSYPGHVATAVYLEGGVAGDSVAYNGKRYAVADPTFINATAGMTMPEYRNIKPQVIAIE